MDTTPVMEHAEPGLTTPKLRRPFNVEPLEIDDSRAEFPDSEGTPEGDGMLMEHRGSGRMLRSALYFGLSGTMSTKAHSDTGMSTPELDRAEFQNITGRCDVIMFDFDGTLTSTPGDRQVRCQKRVEICERASMLRPKLEALRAAGCTLGILSKSTENTIRDALTAGGLINLFDGAIVGKAVGLEGKAGFVLDLARQGGLRPKGERRVGPVAHKILLVDDDLLELERARAAGLQTYAAPADGGLQENDFQVILDSLRLSAASPPRPFSAGKVEESTLPMLCPPPKPTHRGGKWRNVILFSGDCFEG